MPKTIQFQQQQHALVLTLDRPRALNALNTEVMSELRDFFNGGYKEYEAFTAVVITGAGEKAFAAGADIAEINALDAASGEKFAVAGHETFLAIERFRKPVIAAVNGFALGGGCELAMACHMRVASENARFGQPEVNLGLIPGYGGTQRLPQYVGKGKALELMITGDSLSAREAMEYGLVNAVVPQEELIGYCMKLCDKIHEKGPLAVASVIQSVNAYYAREVDGFTMEAARFGALTGTSDFKEGTSAFLEKRKPKFTGE